MGIFSGLPYIWLPTGKKVLPVAVDMDDTLCDCMGEATRIAGVDAAKVLDFHTEECELLTPAEKKQLREVFDAGDYAETMPFYAGAKDTFVLLREAGGDPKIVSNTTNKRGKDIKIQRLLQTIDDLHEEDIIIHIITSKDKLLQKKLQKDLFMLLDDSPYNIAKSPACINAAIEQRWNTTEKAHKLIRGKFTMFSKDLNNLLAYSCFVLQQASRQ